MENKTMYCNPIGVGKALGMIGGLGVGPTNSMMRPMRELGQKSLAGAFQIRTSLSTYCYHNIF